MSKYFITYPHKAGECQGIKQQLMAYANPFAGKVNTVCTCPSEAHEVYFMLEANSLDEAKQVVPEQVRDKLTVMEAEGFSL